MPKNYDTEPEEYETTLYTDYDDAEDDDTADDFEEPLVADFSDEEDVEIDPQESTLADDKDEEEDGEDLS